MYIFLDRTERQRFYCARRLCPSRALDFYSAADFIARARCRSNEVYISVGFRLYIVLLWAA